MRIKMIVTDLDDTFLRDDKTISERTIAAFRKCREKGIKTVYATGRGDSSVMLAPSALFDGFVRMNGATAHAGDKLIYDRLIPISEIRGLLTAADRAGLKIAAESDGRHYANFHVTDVWPYMEDYEIADFKSLDIETEKVYVLAESPEAIDLMERYLHGGLRLCVSRDGLAMVMHSEAMKSKAVAALAAYWDIDIAEVAAFGDDTNDIDLLRECGIGVAVANAVDAAKEAADHICDTNENDGVAKRLETHVCGSETAGTRG